MRRTRRLLVPFAFAATGALMLCLSGCGKESEESAEPPANSPEVYMNDPVFRKALADKRRELQSILKERAPLVKRMEELVKSNGRDRAVLEKIPEWVDLHARVVALNKRYEETRQRQLKIFRDRVAPETGGSRLSRPQASVGGRDKRVPPSGSQGAVGGRDKRVPPGESQKIVNDSQAAQAPDTKKISK